MQETLKDILMELSTPEEKGELYLAELEKMMGRFDEINDKLDQFEAELDARQTDFSSDINKAVDEARADIESKASKAISKITSSFNEKIKVAAGLIKDIQNKNSQVSYSVTNQITDAKKELSAHTESLMSRIESMRDGVFSTVSDVAKDIKKIEKDMKKLISDTKDELNTRISSAMGGGGLYPEQYETPTGTVDGNNTVFFVQNTPKSIIVDGLKKFQTTHYTFLNHKITITDGAPPALYIRSVY